MQRDAVQAVETRLDTPGDPDAALVAIDPRTGGVVAMYGGRNFNKQHVNLATGQGGTGRQAGSAFKVFTLVAALEQHYSLDARWYGPGTITIPDPKCYTDGKPWELSNASDSESGVFTLLSATTHSVNTVYAQVASAVTPEAIVNVAERMGIRTDLEPVCSITLGTQSVTPLDMTDAYATLADHGRHHDPTPLQEVVDPNGTTREIDEEGDQVIPANDADLATSALETVITSGTGTLANIGRPAAGKTGTNQEYRDAWFCGYTPQLAACVWVGHAEGQIPMTSVEGFSPVYGGTIPALIWHDFMSTALADKRVIRLFREPSTEGYTLGPPSPVPSPSPSPSPTPSPTEAPSPTGPTAPTGPSGPTTPSGPSGPTAPSGPTGPSGASGPGASGPTGRARGS